MRKNLSQKGFTLIELSIVLVIIGIILGAVLKGQDLMASAKAKKLTTTVNTWNMLAWTFMDRMGVFPGDANANGVIGNPAAGGELTAAGSAIAVLGAAMDNAPANPVIIGGQSFWIYFGNDTPPSGVRNVMVICTSATCTTAFPADAMRIIQTVDTSIDGVADAGLGQFRGATAVTRVGGGTVAPRTVGVITAVTAVNEATAGAATLWATTQVAAVWLFDRPY